MNSLPDNSVAMITSSPLKLKSYGVNSLFHQNSNFFYLTGVLQPDCLLILRKASNNSTHSVLLCPEPKSFDLQWNGGLSSLESLKECFGFDSVLDISTISRALPAILTNKDNLYVSSFDHPQLEEQIKIVLTPLGYKMKYILN